MNLVIVGLAVTIIATLIYLVPRLVAWVDPAPNATLRTAFASRGMDFSGQVFITNAGRKELAVHSIIISVRDSADREMTFIGTAEDWGEGFVIDGGGVGSKHIPLNRGPGTMKHPITRVVVYHNDGSVQQLMDSSSVVLSNSRTKR